MAKSRPQEKAPPKIRLKVKTSSNSSSSSSSLQLPINFIIVTVSMAVAVWFGYKGYLETRVNTPYDVNKVCELSSSNFTYSQDLVS